MKAVLPHSTAFFPLTAKFPVVQKILSEIPSLSSPDHFQIMRVAAVIVDTNIRELFIHNGMFSTMVMSEILTKLSIQHTVRTEAVAVPDLFGPKRVFGHSFIEIERMHIDLASQIAPYCALANFHGIDPYVKDREKMAALFKTHNIDPQELCYFDDKVEVPIEILGRHIASSTLPPAKRFLVVEADAKVTDGFPLEFFRKAAESPKYYIGGMPPAQRKMWDAVVARGLRTDFFDF